MIRKMILMVAVAGLVVPVIARAEATAIPPGLFRGELNAAAGESMAVEGDALVLQLGPQPNPKEMHRACHDLPVQPNTCYLLSADIDVKSGFAGIIGHIAGKDGQWTDFCRSSVPEGHAAPYFLQINTGPDTRKLRVSLVASGDGAKVSFRNIKLVPVKATGGVLKPVASLPELDAIPGDPAWNEAVKLAPFSVLGSPETSAPEKSEAYLVTDGEDLMVGFRFDEPDMDGMKAEITTDDAIAIYQDDCAQFFLSTDKASYLNLMANSAGTKYWGKRFDKTEFIYRDWYAADILSKLQCKWDVRSKCHEGFWTCVMKARLADLLGHQPSGTETIYLNVTRHRQREDKEENLTWAPLLGTTWGTPKLFLPIKLELPERPGTAAQPEKKFEFSRRLGAPPSPFLAGNPVKLTLRDGKAVLPSGVTLEHVALPEGVRQFLVQNATTPSGSPVHISCEVSPKAVDASGLSGSDRRRMKSREAFSLVLDGDQVKIASRTKEGVLRALATYLLMVRRAEALAEPMLPNLFLLDGPDMDYRGLLVSTDLHPEELRRIIDTAYLLRFNKIVLFMDNFRGVTKFPFTAAPIGGKNFTKEDWKALFERARDFGIEPIPYFSSWSRVEYLTCLPQFVGFGEPIPPHAQKESQVHRFQTPRTLDLANQDAVQLALTLQGELIDTLAPSSLHIAFDELTFSEPPVQLGLSEKARALGWTSLDWMKKALKINTDFAADRNVDIHLWGDTLDPSQNGKTVGIAKPETLAKFPKNMVIYDWKYDQALDYPSIKMFMDAGFKKVVGCPWDDPLNIQNMALSVHRYGAWGMCLTTWDFCDPEKIGPELRRALSLASFFSWSPEGANLDNFSWPPDAIFDLASRRPAPHVGPVLPIAAPQNLLSGENDLAGKLHFPADASLDFLAQPVSSIHGATIQPFAKDGRPAAIVVESGSKPPVVLPVNSKAKRLVFLHSLNRQEGFPANLDRIRGDPRYHAVAGAYRVHYSDGSQTDAKLIFQTDIGDPNHSGLGRGMTPALFGTLNGKRHLNLPTYEWLNPSPEKNIDSVEILPGTLKGVDLLLYGLSAELPSNPQP